MVGEKDQIFVSKIKYDGVFSFKDFYKFCYDWLADEIEFTVIEEAKYSEKIVGNSKNIDVEWKTLKKISDYFRFDAKIEFKILGLSKVELNQGGAKVSSNKGSVEVKVKGILVKDYNGKFEKSATKLMWRSIYEKLINPHRVEQMENMVAGKMDEFLGQAKAFLDIEGKK